MAPPSPNKAAALAAWTRAAPLYGKLTYIGEQTKPVPTVIFHTGYTVPEGIFRPFQASGINYQNDSLARPKSFSLSAEEQGRILTALAGSGFEQDSSNPSWSLVLVQVEGEQRRGTEWLLDSATCKRLMQLISGALSAENSAGKQILSRMPK